MSQLNIPQTVRAAIEHHQAGRLRQAEALYRQILAADPNHVGSLYLLGVVAFDTGHSEIALELVRRAIALTPDIGLDTFPYNGHTTSLDALWNGVPVVTLVGNTVVGRAGLSQLTNLGLHDSLAARTPDDYVTLATRLSHDLPRLAEIRRMLRPRMQASPLMDAAQFSRNVEAAYREMWRTYCTQTIVNK